MDGRHVESSYCNARREGDHMKCCLVESRQQRETVMKVAMLFTGSGPIVILTSHDSVTDPTLLEKLKAKGIERFLAYELPLDLAKERYGGHFSTVLNDLHETDDLRVLDYNGERAFGLFRLNELGDPVIYDPTAVDVRAVG